MTRSLFALCVLSCLVLYEDVHASSLELRSCEVTGVSETLKCGTLSVPENPDRPDATKIDLHIVVVPALENDPQRVPLFDLAGGPGLPATDGASFFVTAGQIHRAHRDVVLIDQRGTGKSHPLHCAEIESASVFSPMYPIDDVRRCRSRLASDADLSQYTTRNSALDIEAVRVALGYTKIDISALSYGTRLALTYIREFPQNVRSAVLTGTVIDDAKIPLYHARNAQSTLDAIFRDCEDDSHCRNAFPQLLRRWRGLLKSIEAAPSVTDVTDGKKVTVRLRIGPFAEAFRQMLTTSSGQRQIPYQISRMSAGDFQPFITRTLHGEPSPLAEGLLLSITCAEDVAWITPLDRTRASAKSFLGSYRIDEQKRACSIWQVPGVEPTRFESPIAVPILFLAGERDPVTPVAWAEKVAMGFSKSRVVVIPKLGHFPEGLEHMECFDAIMSDFFTRGRVEGIDTSCVAAMKPPGFMNPNVGVKH
jgi:pimeloyl-ACP methyl ester carboxylesterase